MAWELDFPKNVRDSAKNFQVVPSNALAEENIKLGWEENGLKPPKGPSFVTQKWQVP
jgi:hypothetical protein